MAAVVSVRCAQLADVEFVCVKTTPRVYLAHMQQLIGVLIQQPVRRLAADAMHSFLESDQGKALHCGGDLKAALGGPLNHMCYTYSLKGRPSYFVTMAGLDALLQWVPFQLELGRWKVQTFIKEAYGRMDVLFGEGEAPPVSSYAAAIVGKEPTRICVPPNELLGVEHAVDALERLLKEIASRAHFSSVRMDSAASMEFLDRSYDERYALMVENCTVTRELAELKDKFACLQKAREHDIVRLVQLDTLGRKYREAWGDIDPEDLKTRLDVGQLQREGCVRVQTEQERMRLQAMEARAMSAEAELVSVKLELAQAQATVRMWQGQVDVQRKLTAAETAKLEALAVKSAREIQEYARWGLQVSEYQARAEAAESASGALAAEVAAVRAELEARDKTIADLRADCEGVVRAEYEAKLSEERAKCIDRTTGAHKELKRKLEYTTREKEREMKQRTRFESEVRALKAHVDELQKQKR